MHQKEEASDDVVRTIPWVTATNFQGLVPALLQNSKNRCGVSGQSQSSCGRCHPSEPHEKSTEKAALNTQRPSGIKTRFEKYLQELHKLITVSVAPQDSALRWCTCPLFVDAVLPHTMCGSVVCKK